MNKTIATIFLTGLLQVTAIAGLVTFLYDRSDEKSYQYSLVAENNAVTRSRADIEKMYQRILEERNADREETHKWVEKVIALRLTRTNLSTGELKE